MEPDGFADDLQETTRRGLLAAAGASSITGALSTLFETTAAAKPAAPDDAPTDSEFGVERCGGTDAYPQSVASGGPTPTGVIAWTRLDSSVYVPGKPVAVRVGLEEAMENVIYRGTVPADAVGPQADYTVQADLHGELPSDRHLFYQFIHDGIASPVGRCRTLPAADASPDRLSLAVANCNSYGSGYYGGYAHIADEDVDFLLHVGDFTYEGAPNSSLEGRSFDLPSGKGKSHTLEDYRFVHKTYRSDEFLQQALQQHTLIHTWDDHELVNNPWWNRENDAPATADHPYSGDPEKLKRLFVRAITAFSEYVPSRVYDAGTKDDRIDGDAIHDEFRLYRSIRFGDLAELFMTDERLYRDGPPEDEFGRRDQSRPPARTADDEDRTMLGEEQLEWFLNGGDNPEGLPDTAGVGGSDALWTVWGNSVMHTAMKQMNAGPATWYNSIARATYDCWDGYRHERSVLADTFVETDNVVVLTGDFHTYVAGYLKENYESVTQSEYVTDDGRIGVEFITTGLSSGNFAAAGGLPKTATELGLDRVVRSMNPHIEWFNSAHWGYATVEITRDGCVYTAWSVDREDNSEDAERILLRSFRVPEGEVDIRELERNPVDRLIGDVEGINSEVGLPDGVDGHSSTGDG